MTKKEYQRVYARKRYHALTPEERKRRNSSEAARAAKAKYRATAKGKAMERAQNRRWYEQNRAKKDLATRCSKYGIKPSDYRRMLLEQDNVCAACKQDFDGTPHIDHCHKTNVVRSLLCWRCNTAIGLLDESIVRASGILVYIVVLCEKGRL